MTCKTTHPYHYYVGTQIREDKVMSKEGGVLLDLIISWNLECQCDLSNFIFIWYRKSISGIVDTVMIYGWYGYLFVVIVTYLYVMLCLFGEKLMTQVSGGFLWLLLLMHYIVQLSRYWFLLCCLQTRLKAGDGNNLYRIGSWFVPRKVNTKPKLGSIEEKPVPRTVTL